MKLCRTSIRVLLLAVFAPAAVGQGHFFPVPLPVGGTESSMRDCSGDGAVVAGNVTITSPSLVRSGYRWSAAEGVTLLRPLGPPVMPVLDQTGANAVSSDGTTLGGWGSNSRELSTSIIWPVAAAPIDLGTGPLMFIPVSEVTDLSANGRVVIGRDPTFAYRWTDATGRVPMAGMGLATAVTADGSRVFGRSNLAGIGPAYWEAATGVTGLGDPLPLGASAEVNDCSSDGAVAVGFQRPGITGPRAARWVGLSSVEILPLTGSPAGAVDARALGVSDDGLRVVGRESLGGGSSQQAIYWSPSTGTVLLRDHLLGLGITGVADYRLIEARAISDDGNCIIGWGERLDTPGIDVGFAVYLDTPSFAVGDTECNGAAVTSSGLSGHIMAVGDPAAAANDVTLVAQRLPVSAPGYFLCSRTADVVIGPGGSQGTLCLGGAIGRFIGPGQVFLSGPGGEARLSLDVNNLPQPTGGVPAIPGDTWRFQAWFRDVNPASTNNFTNAVAWTVQ